MLNRHSPPAWLEGIPCSIVALSCATGRDDIVTDYREKDGWLTLKKMNEAVRKYLPIRKYTYYKRGERPLLCGLNLKGKAIVTVYGHSVYLDGNDYYSFFNNENDEVVAVWEIRDEGGRTGVSEDKKT